MTAQDTLPEYEAIVAACVDRIERGETVQECLSGLSPQVAAELAPSLYAAERLTRVRLPAMDSAAMLRVESRLLAHAETLGALNREASCSHTYGWKRVVARFGAIALFAVIALAIVALGGGGILAVSANSLPGAPLYPVKRAAEQVQLTFTQDPTQRATLHTTFALRRLKEAVLLNQEQKRWDAATLKDMEDELNQAAGHAGARIVWEHIADATSSGEQELAGSSEDETILGAVGILRQLHARADEELSRDDEHLDEERQAHPTASPMGDTPTLAPPAIATAAPGRKADEAEAGVRLTPAESSEVDSDQSGTATGHEAAVQSSDGSDKEREHLKSAGSGGDGERHDSGGADNLTSSGNDGERHDSGGADSLTSSRDEGEGHDSGGADSLTSSGNDGESHDSGDSHSSNGGERKTDGGERDNHKSGEGRSGDD